ncbi:hypothetical protein L6452_20142 [Arctium lappa]|uniref:Uncharacterized protein n=1 Tax=Arctium lappa TaxID=4217 RepID=A0ACB9BB34_ARCLA|nr:hypothetical protein L6452_20142 [Arctium lappa]
MDWGICLRQTLHRPSSSPTASPPPSPSPTTSPLPSPSMATSSITIHPPTDFLICFAPRGAVAASMDASTFLMAMETEFSIVHSRSLKELSEAIASVSRILILSLMDSDFRRRCFSS